MGQTEKTARGQRTRLFLPRQLTSRPGYGYRPDVPSSDSFSAEPKCCAAMLIVNEMCGINHFVYDITG